MRKGRRKLLHVGFSFGTNIHLRKRKFLSLKMKLSGWRVSTKKKC